MSGTQNGSSGVAHSGSTESAASANATGAIPARPNTEISQQTTRNGMRVCKATCSTQKVLPNADVTLPQALAKVQNLAHGILEANSDDITEVEQLLEVIRASFDEDGLAPQQPHDIAWAERVEEFVDAVESACEIQVNESEEEIVKLLKVLENDVSSAISCIDIFLKFSSREARIKFVTELIEGKLSQQIAAAVFNQEFCTQFKQLDENMKDSDGESLHPSRKKILCSFLEQLVDLITIRITFRVDQLIESRSAEPVSTYDFRFRISAAKLVLPNHDTKSGDMRAVAHQIDAYLKQDKDTHELFRPILSAMLPPSRESGDIGSADLNGAGNSDAA